MDDDADCSAGQHSTQMFAERARTRRGTSMIAPLRRPSLDMSSWQLVTLLGPLRQHEDCAERAGPHMRVASAICVGKRPMT